MKLKGNEDMSKYEELVKLVKDCNLVIESMVEYKKDRFNLKLLNPITTCTQIEFIQDSNIVRIDLGSNDMCEVTLKWEGCEVDSFPSLLKYLTHEGNKELLEVLNFIYSLNSEDWCKLYTEYNNSNKNKYEELMKLLNEHEMSVGKFEKWGKRRFEITIIYNNTYNKSFTFKLKQEKMSVDFENKTTGYFPDFLEDFDYNEMEQIIYVIEFLYSLTLEDLNELYNEYIKSKELNDEILKLINVLNKYGIELTNVKYSTYYYDKTHVNKDGNFEKVYKFRIDCKIINEQLRKGMCYIGCESSSTSNKLKLTNLHFIPGVTVHKTSFDELQSISNAVNEFKTTIEKLSYNDLMKYIIVE